MVLEKPRRFANMNNVQLLNALRNELPDDYKSRIPVITKANQDTALRELDNYIPGQNAIISQMLNKVGLTNFNAGEFSNTFAEFKKGTLNWGESVEEVQLGLINAITKDVDRETGEKLIFSRKDIESNVWYHQVNREELYPITIDSFTNAEIRKAFHSESGLNSWLSAIQVALNNSAEYDEFLQMTGLLKHYHDNNGFTTVNVPDVAADTSSTAEAKGLLRIIRATAAKLAYPTRKYNAARMPTFVKPQDLILICTPEVAAAVDIEALASIFHLEKAEVPMRMIVIPQEYWDIPNAQAILTSVNFFQVYDVLKFMTEIDNPVGLYKNFFLHIHQIISYSLAVPAVLFTTEPSTVFSVNAPTITGLGATTIQDGITGETVVSATRGKVYEMFTTATSTVAGEHTTTGYRLVQPGTSVQTRVSDSGILFVGADEEADTIKVEVFSPYDLTKSRIETVALIGDVFIEFPPEIIDKTP